MTWEYRLVKLGFVLVAVWVVVCVVTVIKAG